MKKCIGIVLLTAAFAVLAAACFAGSWQTANVLALSVEVVSDGQTETIRCWQDGNGQNYFFLPSYAEHMMLRTDTAEDIVIDGKTVNDGMPLAGYEWNRPYDLLYRVWGGTKHESITFVQSANAAAMYVDTESGSMEYIHSQKGVKETATMRLYDMHGQSVYAGNLESIGGRGNNTWDEFDKKPYSITLSDESDLLGMGKAARWILLANADDHSHLRNKMIYDFAAEMGMAYSPDSKWTDLYLNGEYAGLYLLSERNEVHSQRVDLSNDGSFLVSLEMSERLKDQGIPFAAMESGQTLRIHFPLEPSQATIEMLEAEWQMVENAILDQNHSSSGTIKPWNEWIDVDSWANKYLIEEVFGNGDGCWISQFFYRNREDGLIYAGPVWDYDHTTGNPVAWQFETANVFVGDRLQVKDGYNAPWFYALNRKPEFASRVKELYQQVFLPLLQEYFDSRLPQYAAEAAQAALLDQIRWGIETSFQDEVQIIQAFMADRIAFLNSVWIDEKEYCRVRADHGFGGFYAYYAIEPGACLMELPVFEDTETQHFLGWYYVDSGEPVDLTRPVQEDFQIIARWQETSAKKLDQLMKLVPLGVIACLGAAMLLAEIARGRRAGGKAWRRK